MPVGLGKERMSELGRIYGNLGGVPKILPAFCANAILRANRVGQEPVCLSGGKLVRELLEELC